MNLICTPILLVKYHFNFHENPIGECFSGTSSFRNLLNWHLRESKAALDNILWAKFNFLDVPIVEKRLTSSSSRQASRQAIWQIRIRTTLLVLAQGDTCGWVLNRSFAEFAKFCWGKFSIEDELKLGIFFPAPRFSFQNINSNLFRSIRPSIESTKSRNRLRVYYTQVIWFIETSTTKRTSKASVINEIEQVSTRKYYLSIEISQ